MAKKKETKKLGLAGVVLRAFGKKDTETDETGVKIRNVAPRQIDEREIEKQVRGLLADCKYARVNRLYIIGLEKVRDYHGENWDRIAPKALQICETVLGTHLTRSDTCVGLGNLGYVVMFGTVAKPEAAEIKAGMIAAEIHNRLLGGIQDAKDISTVSVSESADGGVMFVEKTVIETVSDMIADKANESRESPEHTESGSGEQFWSHDARVKHGEAGATPREAAEPAWIPDKTTFVYKPVWDVRRKVLSTYRCAPKCTGPSGTPVYGYDIISGANPEEAYPDLDMLTLETAARTLKDLHGRKRRVIVVCPIHYRTLVRNDSFPKFKIFCQSMTDEQRRDIIFELLGVSDVTSAPGVIDLVSALKSMGRSVVLPVRLNRTRFEELSARGFDTVGTDVSAFARNEAKTMELMNTFLTGASEAGLRTVARGLDTLTLAIAAVAAGFDHVEGLAVHDIVENPEHVFRFQTQDLFAKMMGHGG